MSRRITSAAIAAFVIFARPSVAKGEEGDGIYGRLDGDLDLRLGAGAALFDGEPAFGAFAELVYVQTVGLYGTYLQPRSDFETTRTTSFGVHFQPLFFDRYAKNTERGPTRLDLMIDSFALQMGAAFTSTLGNGWDTDAGFETAVRMAVPIFAQATGPFIDLRASTTFPADAFYAKRDPIHCLALFLSWHQLIDANLATLRQP